LNERRLQVHVAGVPTRLLEALSELGVRRRELVVQRELEHADHLRARVGACFEFRREHYRAERREEILALPELQAIERMTASGEHDLTYCRRQALDEMQERLIRAAMRLQLHNSMWMVVRLGTRARVQAR